MILATLLSLTPPLAPGDGHWTQWRGPTGTGVAASAAPLEWSDDKNVKWKVALEGRGFSTPVVWGERLFLTTAVPTGKEPPKPEQPEEPEEPREGRGRGVASGIQPEQEFRVLCLNRADGTELWSTPVHTAFPHEGYHRQYGSFASPSPVLEEGRVYASFGSYGVFALDHDGELLWKADLGVQMSMRRAFGEGTAPVVAGDSLILVCDHEEQSFIVALNKHTGEELWRADRDEPSTWAQPLVTEIDGRTHVVTSGTTKIRSYDPKTGEVLWQTDGVGLNAIPAPVRHEDLVLCMSGFREPKLKAIRLGGSGELDPEATVWSTEKGLSYTCAPVLHGGKLYCLMDRGMISCFDAETGEVHFREERLPRGSNFKASPLAAGDRLYLASESGDVYVLGLKPEFELLATNTLEGQFFVSSPIAVEGELFLRSQTHLFCIAEVGEDG